MSAEDTVNKPKPTDETAKAVEAAMAAPEAPAPASEGETFEHNPAEGDASDAEKLAAVRGRLAGKNTESGTDEVGEYAFPEDHPNGSEQRFTKAEVDRAVEAFKGVIPGGALMRSFYHSGEEGGASYEQCIDYTIVDEEDDDAYDIKHATRLGVVGTAGVTVGGLALSGATGLGLLSGAIPLVIGGGIAYLVVRRYRNKAAKHKAEMEAAKKSLFETAVA